ncbi:flagellar P-ring protein [Massilia varians]|uniref:Flagellar P-ring protein n=1 Tax=Massilia varians TaxID=457921 RepID=A0ABN6THM5_9BURK|nr:flagellar basal body P-ring protein FlgI [Massilia varians]BDT60590.1 flagellar P-ring protein [Massilia varians]
MKSASIFLICAALLGTAPLARGERIKDLASIAGVRQNQLSGYGIVVGLDGTGDQTSQTPFTVQSIGAMLQQKGVTLPPGTQLQLKNVAAVMVTTSLPAFAQPGQTIDITVSSIGNAKSLRGGTLLMTPLHGADGQVYAMAQGNVLVGGVGAQAGGAQVQVNHLSVGKISDGATVERAVASNLGADNQIRLELKQTDFSTAARMVEAINDQFGAGVATALDGRVVRVRTPSSSDQRVAFIGQLESIDVARARDTAKVIMNARTGSVVMNQAVILENCAISHGNLTVTVGADTSVSQPAPGSLGGTAVTRNNSVDVKKDPGRVLMVKGGASLAEVVKAMNSIGATPQDLLAILQALKAAGSLRAELEII